MTKEINENYFFTFFPSPLGMVVVSIVSALRVSKEGYPIDLYQIRREGSPALGIFKKDQIAIKPIDSCSSLGFFCLFFRRKTIKPISY